MCFHARANEVSSRQVFTRAPLIQENRYDLQRDGNMRTSNPRQCCDLCGALLRRDGIHHPLFRVPVVPLSHEDTVQFLRGYSTEGSDAERA